MEFLDDFKPVDPREYLANRVKRGTAFVAALLALNKTVDLSTSNHINRGGAPMLDETLDVQPELPFQPPFETPFNTSGR